VLNDLYILPQVAIDSIFFASCMNIAAFCENLRESFDGDVKKFVQKHLQILELAKALNSLYQPIIFAQLFTNNILLCMIGYQLVIVSDVYALFSNAPFGLAALNQLFLYCYGGQIILTTTESITRNFYQTDKDQLIAIAGTSKGYQIKAVIYNANLPTFRTILGSAQSLITFLKSFT
jgi:hypothetical protein